MSSGVQVLSLADAIELAQAGKLPDDARVVVAPEDLWDMLETRLDLPPSHGIKRGIGEFYSARIERIEQPEGDGFDLEP